MALSEYTTVASLVHIVPRIGSFTTVTSARVAGTIQAVSARIDSKLAKRYDTPFTDVPPLIIRITNDLTMSRLLRSLLTFDDPAVTEWYDKFQGDEATASDDLKDLVDGEMILVDSGGDVVVQIETSGQLLSSSNETYKPIFDMRVPTAWEVDTDRIEDEGDE